MNYLPFCISNNTAMDVVTLAQEQASFNQAVSVQPLTSRMVHAATPRRPAARADLRAAAGRAAREGAF